MDDLDKATATPAKTPLFQALPFLTPASPLTKVASAFKRRWLALKAYLAKLTSSQWLYLLAALGLLSSLEEGSEPNYAIVGLFAGLGLSREFWRLFVAVWEHMLGKALLLVLYAATANFAMAVSAVKINQIVHVEPSFFVFTFGFATLLMLPFWLLLASTLFLSCALVVANFWLLLRFFLGLLGVQLKVFWQDQVLVALTMIIRIILIPTLIFALWSVMQPYLQQMNLFTEEFTLGKGPRLTDEERQQLLARIEEEKQKQEAGSANEDLLNLLQKQLQENDRLSFSMSLNEAQLPPEVQAAADANQAQMENKSTWIDRVIANFIFNFEAYPHSACHKGLQERSIIVDENSVLIVSPDQKHPLGYRFSLRACVPVYEANPLLMSSGNVEQESAAPVDTHTQ